MTKCAFALMIGESDDIETGGGDEGAIGSDIRKHKIWNKSIGMPLRTFIVR